MTSDERFMERALVLAERVRGDTAPNPGVGTVIVDSAERIVGEAHTGPGGRPHAESRAVDAAGDAARGATMYVTLEPCCHQGLTAPCTDAIVAAGITRVVIAQEDPDERVAGAGIDLLRERGVDVAVGVRREEAERQLEAYRHHRSTGRPFVVLKLAVTIDGRIAAPDGTSRWITGEEARADAHELRRASDVVLVGSGTILADDPLLTVRTEPPPREQPVRVVADARGRTPADAAVFSSSGEAIVATVRADTATRRTWEEAGIAVESLPAGEGGGVDLEALLDWLGTRGMLQVLVEGGATLGGALIRGGLVQKLVVYTGAVVGGGSDARAMFAGPAFGSIGEFLRPRLVGATVLGQDIRAVYELGS